MALKLYYKKYKSQPDGYLFIACAEDYQHFLKGGYKALPSLSAVQADNFLEAYNRLVEDCRGVNKGNKFFAMTPFALRNTWQSSFYHGAESFARLQNVREGDAFFSAPEWFLWAAQKMSAQVAQEDVQRARRDLYKRSLYQLYMAYQGIRFLWSRFVPHQTLVDFPHFFMASIWTTAGLVKWEKEGCDPFYADLPILLQNRGYDTVVLYHDEGHNKPPEKNSEVPAINIAACLKLSDWLCLAWKTLTFRIKLPEKSEFPLSAVRRDIANSLSNQIPLALISYQAVRNLIDSRNADFISLYENNCWEQGLLKAAHEGTCKVTSFQHTAFAPALLKMDNHLPDKIMPDMVVTTGPETTSILKDVMGYQGHVQAGYSLRYKSESSPITNQGHKILVLLQGAPDDSLFLHTVSQHFKSDGMIIRGHPSWPLRSEKFTFSQNSLSHDLSQSVVSLYTGTTAAFESLLVGVPVIHIHLGGPFTADPLFRLQNCAVKETWLGGADLSDMIRRVTTLPEDKRQSAFEMAHRYISSYFVSADEAAIDSLIKKITDE